MKWITQTQPIYAYLFLYQGNAGDELLYPARFMISLVGVLLGVLIFCWARELMGFWPAVFALGFYTIEPNILAHASLVTTDFGVTWFFFGAIYFLWRTARCLTGPNVLGLAALTVFAVISKYSALLLGPIIILLLLVHSLRETSWSCRLGGLREIPTRLGRIAASAALVVMLFVLCWCATWASYGFHYTPSSTPGWRFQFDSVPFVLEHAPKLARVVSWIDLHHLLPNAFSEGFVLQQAKESGRPTFFLGRTAMHGWWYYFPVAFLIKTPVSLILLFLGGMVVCALRWKEFLKNYVFVLVPVFIYMSVAMHSDLNIGLRHILPIFPFVILLCALAASEFLRSKSRIARPALGLLCLFWIFEFARVYPHNLAFFNELIGGPQNGYKYLSASNLDWGQDIKPLKRWMDQHGVQSINLAVFGPADPAYYGIQCTYMPGAAMVARTQVSLPQLPAYVAISPMVFQGTLTGEPGKQFYKPLLDREPTAVIGYSIRIYWAESPWWNKIH